jgi:hypothetical protein
LDLEVNMAKGGEKYPKDKYVKNDGAGGVKSQTAPKPVSGSDKTKTGRAGK